MWKEHAKEVIPEVLTEDFLFRGSLGQEKRGHAGFCEYVDMVHNALQNYLCTIDNLVVEAPQAFAKVTFSGIQCKTFMGYPPTNKRLT